MIWVVSRMRGYMMFALVVLIASSVSWSASEVNADLPLADGPRVIRQFVIAFMPSLGAPLLIDKVPDLSAALVRSSALRRMDVCIFWVGLAIALVPGWSGVADQTIHYEVVVALAMSSIIIVVTAKLGDSGVLCGAIAGMVWILFGGAAAMIAGFPGVAWDSVNPVLSPAAYVQAETSIVVLCAIGATIVYPSLR